MKEINNGELNISNVGDKVTLKGWVANRRKMRGLEFIDLRDRWGITQLVILNPVEAITKESILEVTGKVVERKDKNKNIPTGDIEIQVTTIKILSKSETPPFVIKDDVEAKEENRLSFRYLDLRRPKMIKNLILRHKVIKMIRDFLDSKDFLEIETPILSKSMPEGARDFLVPTRNKGKFFALPQSPQLYKQLLMASGVEKYFQFARAFRDEDSRSDRQPEFTQLDIEASFVSEEQIINLMEDMYKVVFNGLGYKIKTPFRRMSYKDAIDKYGSDKPDLRFDYQLVDITNFFSNTNFNVIKNASSIKMISIPEILSKKEISQLEEVAKKNGASGLLWATIPLKNEEPIGTAIKFCKKEITAVQKKFDIKKGTILVIASDYEITTQALGAVRTELNNMFKYAKSGFHFVWIVDWPLFEMTKDGWNAMHHPFTQPTPDTIDSFDQKPAIAKARAYDLALNGSEIGGGSIRINDLKTQTKMFDFLGIKDANADTKFGFFLRAFKYGIPPHGGIAFGIDRLIMILANEESIREVIAFPKNTKGFSPMEEGPSATVSTQLDEYFLKIK